MTSAAKYKYRSAGKCFCQRCRLSRHPRFRLLVNNALVRFPSPPLLFRLVVESVYADLTLIPYFCNDSAWLCRRTVSGAVHSYLRYSLWVRRVGVS